MIVYQSEKRQFIEDVVSNSIEKKILSQFQLKLNRTTTAKEINSWKNSMMYMQNILMDTDIPETCGVAIEYKIPLTSKRVDFILSGTSEEKEGLAIIIELKQWSDAKKTDRDGIVISFIGGRERELSHPSYQAWSYAAIIRDFNEAVYNANIPIHPCAYLHNFETSKDIFNDSFYKEYTEKAPVFLREDALKLRAFIKRHVKHGDSGDTIYKIDSGRIRPSKSLADKVSSLLKGNQEFVMIDDQKVVFEAVLSYTRLPNKKKTVIIVDGGPGTGKTVVAMNLLSKLLNEGKNAQYVTKNSAPRSVYEAKLVADFKKSAISNLFSGSGAYTATEPNTFDILIVDEAHRLNEKSGMFQNLGENQVKELINSSSHTVFFIDENQKVSLKDIGTKEEIEKWAGILNADVVHLELASQFRCNGSDGYIAWLDNTLQIKETANETLEGIDYDFRIVSSPSELRDLIVEKNKINNRARLVAGYCWDWKSKKDHNAYDIVFHEFNFQMRWNLTDDGMLWIMKKESVDQVGCIHTCQGLELDYVGVIIGDDMTYTNGAVQTNVLKRSTNDSTIKGYKKLLREKPIDGARQLDVLIKNTYRTLMTRGMKGCYVYCVDKGLEDYLRKKLE
jgi:DUF2075 family protein